MAFCLFTGQFHSDTQPHSQANGLFDLQGGLPSLLRFQPQLLSITVDSSLTYPSCKSKA